MSTSTKGSRVSPTRPIRRALAGLLVGAAAVAAVAASATPAQALGPYTIIADWGTNGRVNTILPVGDRVYIGGTFSALIDSSGRSYPAGNLAVYRPSMRAFDLTFTGSTNGAVRDIVTDGSALWIGGQFTTVNGDAKVRIASIDPLTGATRSAFRANANKSVNALQLHGGALYAGGDFTSVNSTGNAVSRSFAAKLDPTTGVVDTTWNANLNGAVNGLAATSDTARVYLTGEFTSAGGRSMNYVASVSTAAGSASSGFNPGSTSGYGSEPTLGMEAAGGRLYIAGAGYQGGVASMDPLTGATAWTKTADGDVQCITTWGSEIWVGGHFTLDQGIGGTGRSRLANLSPTGALLDVNYRINSTLGVWSLASDGNRIYVGGDFTTIDGKAANRFATITNNTDPTAPSAPTALTATPGDSQVSLAWNAPASTGNATLGAYNVYRAQAGGAFALVGTATARTYLDTTVSNGVTYAYRVTATNAVGESAPSPSVSAVPSKPVPVPPSAPTSVATTGTDTSVTVTWAAPSNPGSHPVSGYQVYKAATSTGTPVLIGSTTGARTFTDSGLSQGAVGYYSVAAVSAAGEGPRSATVQGTAVSWTVPGAPVASSSWSWFTSYLNWTAPANTGGTPITGYQVLRNGTVVATTSASTRSYTVGWSTGSYQVRAVNAVGAGALSNTVTF